MLDALRIRLAAYADTAASALGRVSTLLREAAPPPPAEDERDEPFPVVDPVTPEAAALRVDLDRGRHAPPAAAGAPLAGSLEARAAARRGG